MPARTWATSSETAVIITGLGEAQCSGSGIKHHMPTNTKSFQEATGSTECSNYSVKNLTRYSSPFGNKGI